MERDIKLEDLLHYSVSIIPDVTPPYCTFVHYAGQEEDDIDPDPDPRQRGYVTQGLDEADCLFMAQDCLICWASGVWEQRWTNNLKVPAAAAPLADDKIIDMPLDWALKMLLVHKMLQAGKDFEQLRRKLKISHFRMKKIFGQYHKTSIKRMQEIYAAAGIPFPEIKEDAGIRLLKDPRADKKYRQQIKLAFRSNFICRGRKKRFPGHYAVSSS